MYWWLGKGLARWEKYIGLGSRRGRESEAREKEREQERYKERESESEGLLVTRSVVLSQQNKNLCRYATTKETERSSLQVFSLLLLPMLRSLGVYEKVKKMRAKPCLFVAVYG